MISAVQYSSHWYGEKLNFLVYLTLINLHLNSYS